MAKHRRKVGAKRRKRRVGSSPVIGKSHKRKRRMGSSPVIGASHKRRSKHSMRGPKRKRRRMGAPGGMGSAGEYFGLLLGTGVGLTVAEIGTRVLNNAITPIGSAVVKMAASVGTFAVNKAYMKDNSFVKGVSIGFGGSAINDGLRALRGMGIISGVPDVVINIQDNNQRALKPGGAAQLPAGSAAAVTSSPVIGMEQWHNAVPLNY